MGACGLKPCIERLTAQRPPGSFPPVTTPAPDRASAWKGRALTWGPIAVAVAVLAERSIATVLARLGHPGAALDDAYIHFQYARAIAEGHPLRFEAGEPFTSGATSLLWPTLLAPFYAVGFRGEAIVWPAWGLSFLALAALAWEASRLAEKLAGRAAGVGAGAMVLCFSAFTWCAASGMEVVPFAWAIARATRRAAEWAEDPAEARTARRAWELVALSWIATFFRPEGALQALYVGATLVAFPRTRAWRERARGGLAIAAAAALPLLLLVLTGSARSNTAVAKLLPGNPYFVGSLLTERVVYQVRQLVGVLLNGEVWSAEFLPHGGAPVWMGGLGAIAILGWRAKMRWRGAGVLVLALAIFAPCFYDSFLWNRLRYLWPFATGWIVGLACLARVVGDLLASLRPRWRVATPVLCGVFAGMLATKVEGTIDDVAWSASGIDRQQVALGQWTADNLPADALVGVNDTGAIAYFGGRRTFDIVGLTTRDEARYYVAGSASRLEHYERLRGSGKLPTHFIVYPDWMGLPMILGDELTQATVSDAGRSILGGETMIAYAADWSRLGTGEKPWTPGAGEPFDVLDVADLESEAEHEYALLGARQYEQLAHEGGTPDGDIIVDGGRTRRWRETFVAHLRPGVAARCIVRLQGPPAATVAVLAGDEPVGTLAIDYDPDWVEREVEIPAHLATARTRIDLRVSGGVVTTFHYWFVPVSGG
jgi:hypothetical protein